MIADHNFGELIRWLADLELSPVVSFVIGTTISAAPQSELELIKVENLLDLDKIIFVIKLVDVWEVLIGIFYKSFFLI